MKLFEKIQIEKTLTSGTFIKLTETKKPTFLVKILHFIVKLKNKKNYIVIIFFSFIHSELKENVSWRYKDSH